jgi:hypothetical protein
MGFRSAVCCVQGLLALLTSSAIAQNSQPPQTEIFGLHVSAAPDAVSKQQRFTLSYIVMARQLRASGETSPEFEIAAAAYDMAACLIPL